MTQGTGLGTLGLLAIGVGTLYVAAGIASASNGSTSSRQDSDIICRPAPPSPPKPKPAPMTVIRKPPPTLTADKVIVFLILALACFATGMALMKLVLHTLNGLKHV